MSDETGARAVTLADIRRFVEHHRTETDGRKIPRMLGAAEFLLAELDRVTAERDTLLTKLIEAQDAWKLFGTEPTEP